MWRSKHSGRNISNAWGQPPSAVRRSEASRARAPAPHKTANSQRAIMEKEMAKVAGILGKKVGMTQLFDDKGDVHPATVLQAGPCVITQHKTETRDGSPTAQIGWVEL